ncbi:MAG: hypothetical protein IV090_19780 [Candidatus Sericytochromatia bacterium]|nr:hypothetical protein [Candidatus Sericytochromatia bacterium]
MGKHKFQSFEEIQKDFSIIPNSIFDILASPDLNPYETKILVIIARNTYGWKADFDEISVSQFMGKDGSENEQAVMSKPTVIKSLRSLEEKGLILSCSFFVNKVHKKLYFINTAESAQLVQQIQSGELDYANLKAYRNIQIRKRRDGGVVNDVDRGSQSPLPGVVNDVDRGSQSPLPTKGNLKEKENTNTKTSPRAREKFSQDPDPPQNEPLILEMMAIESPGGTPLNRRQAERLCKTYGPEACRKQLDWLPYRSRQNPVAVFQAALKDNLPAPKAWLWVMAEAQQKKEAELQARSAEADLQARRDADRDQKARLAAEKAAWDALSLEEQQAILDERERKKQLEEQQRRENNPVSKAKAALAAQGITKERALIPPIPPSPRNYPEASS